MDNHLDDDRMDSAPWNRNPYIVVPLGILVATIIYGVVSWATGIWPWNGSGFEAFRAWNACPMHTGETPYPYNSCNRHSMTVDGSPAPLGDSYSVKLLDNKKNGCSCSCTCPRGMGASSSLKQATSDMLENASSTDLPSLSELKSYAKNMWDSTVTDSGNGMPEVKPASGVKPRVL